MYSPANHPYRALLVLALLAALGIAAYAGHLQSDQSMEELNSGWSRDFYNSIVERKKAKTPAEAQKVQSEYAKKERDYVARSLALAKKSPNSADALIALKLIACRTPATPEGKQASQSLIKQAASADLETLAKALHFPTNVSDDPVYPVVPIVLDRVKKNLAHPQAARLLASVVCGSVDRDAVKPPAEFKEAADLIVGRYADSPDITNFCEIVGFLGEAQKWAVDYEKHLRTILQRNKHRDVLVSATYSLASVVAATDDRQEEAEKLYEEAIKKYDGSHDYHYAGIEKDLNGRAKKTLAELQSIGKPAQEIDGVDLDDKALKLSEFRGKVVLVSFWATWCGPCMKMIPHEKTMAERLTGKPFVLIGVNGDQDQEAAKSAVTKNAITWRSFKDANAGRYISNDWHVRGWPTFYLIDQKGIIRKRWMGGNVEEMDQAIDQLLAG
jgi:thiol-disulfide isomerase/thioredoxin